MTCLRCPICLISWPQDDDYKNCPSCESKTDLISNVNPDMSNDEARSMTNNFKFDRFYADWDASHPPERISTDGLPEYTAVPS